MKRMRVGMSAVAATTLVIGLSACTSVSNSGGSKSSAPAATSSASSAPSSASSSDTGSSSSSPSSSSSSSASSSDAAGGDQNGLVSGKVGQELKTSKMSAKINKVVDPVPQGSNRFMTPPAGKRWVAVNMTVTNLDSKPLAFSDTFCLKGKTDQNASARTTILSDYGTSFNTGDLAKGDVATGDVTFEIPQGQKLKSVDVKCSLSFEGDQRTMRFDVSQ